MTPSYFKAVFFSLINIVVLQITVLVLQLFFFITVYRNKFKVPLNLKNNFKHIANTSYFFAISTYMKKLVLFTGRSHFGVKENV